MFSKHIRPKNKFVIISLAWVNKKALLTFKIIRNNFQIWYLYTKYFLKRIYDYQKININKKVYSYRGREVGLYSNEESLFQYIFKHKDTKIGSRYIFIRPGKTREVPCLVLSSSSLCSWNCCKEDGYHLSHSWDLTIWIWSIVKIGGFKLLSNK